MGDDEHEAVVMGASTRRWGTHLVGPVAAHYGTLSQGKRRRSLSESGATGRASLR